MGILPICQQRISVKLECKEHAILPCRWDQSRVHFISNIPYKIFRSKWLSTTRFNVAFRGICLIHNQ